MRNAIFLSILEKCNPFNVQTLLKSFSKQKFKYNAITMIFLAILLIVALW